MLEARNLVYCYGRFKALSGISFRAETGVNIVTGPNGAGKTTLLRVVAGLLPPARGRILLDGVDLIAQREAARASLSYLPDSVPLYYDLTVAEHLTYRAQLKGFTGRRLRARLRHVAETFDLRSLVNVRTGRLSAGQKRLVGLADAFLSESRLLILDEPFADLDDTHSRALCAALASTARHAVVLVATHCFHPLPGLEGRCVVLSAGTLAGVIPLSGAGLEPLRDRVATTIVSGSGKEAPR